MTFRSIATTSSADGRGTAGARRRVHRAGHRSGVRSGDATFACRVALRSSFTSHATAKAPRPTRGAGLTARSTVNTANCQWNRVTCPRQTRIQARCARGGPCRRSRPRRGSCRLGRTQRRGPWPRGPRGRARSTAISGSQRRTILSSPPVARVLPSGLKARARLRPSRRHVCGCSSRFPRACPRTGAPPRCRPRPASCRRGIGHADDRGPRIWWRRELDSGSSSELRG